MSGLKKCEIVILVLVKSKKGLISSTLAWYRTSGEQE